MTQPLAHQEFNSPFKKSKKNELTDTQKELVREYVKLETRMSHDGSLEQFTKDHKRALTIESELGL